MQLDFRLLSQISMGLFDFIYSRFDDYIQYLRENILSKFCQNKTKNKENEIFSLDIIFKHYDASFKPRMEVFGKC